MEGRDPRSPCDEVLMVQENWTGKERAKRFEVRSEGSDRLLLGISPGLWNLCQEVPDLLGISPKVLA